MLCCDRYSAAVSAVQFMFIPHGFAAQKSKSFSQWSPKHALLSNIINEQRLKHKDTSVLIMYIYIYNIYIYIYIHIVYYINCIFFIYNIIYNSIISIMFAPIPSSREVSHSNYIYYWSFSQILFWLYIVFCILYFTYSDQFYILFYSILSSQYILFYSIIASL